MLVLANGESIIQELFPGPWEEERQRLGKLGVQGFLGGDPSLAAYTPRGQLGLMSVEEYGALIAQRERATLIEELRKAQVRGELEEVFRRLAAPEGQG